MNSRRQLIIIKLCLIDSPGCVCVVVLSLPFHSTITTLYTCCSLLISQLRFGCYLSEFYVSCRRIVLDIVFLFIYPAFLLRRVHTHTHTRARITMWADENERACVSCNEIAATELLAVCVGRCVAHKWYCVQTEHTLQTAALKSQSSPN